MKKKMLTGLGRPPIRAEGEPLHPEDIYGSWNWSHEEFMEQAKVYYNFHGMDKEWEDFQERFKKVK